jgi:hypothetical protein
VKGGGGIKILQVLRKGNQVLLLFWNSSFYSSWKSSHEVGKKRGVVSNLLKTIGLFTHLDSCSYVQLFVTCFFHLFIWLLYSLFFYLRFLITSLVSSNISLRYFTYFPLRMGFMKTGLSIDWMLFRVKWTVFKLYSLYKQGYKALSI